MKKRIFSLLLLFAMLVTAVPVMTASAAEAGGSSTAQTEEPAVGDLYEWYVKDGLQNLFTTFGDDNGVSMEASTGTWTAKIGTGKATFVYGSGRWTEGEFGGIGFNVLYGTVDANGGYTTNSTYNNHHKGYLRLNFDAGLLPLGDFTLEYLAMYKPIYVADTNGSILVVDGKKVEAYDAFAGVLPTGWASSSNKALDRVGWYTSFTDCIDGANSLTNKDSSRGQIIWCFDNPTWTSGGNSRRVYSHVENDPYQTNNVIRTYSLSVAETKESGATKAVFALYRDSVSYFTQNASTTGTYGATYYASGTAYKNKELSLSHSRPTDFFAARIYNRALTVEEMKINRLVDLLLYYGVGLTEEQVANLKLRDSLASSLSSFAFVTDGEEVKAAKKEEIKAAISDALEAFAAVERPSEWYVKDGLQNLFTTFGDDNGVSMEASTGTWTAKIGTGKATFVYGSQRWTQNDDGSVGFDVLYGTVDANGGYTTDSTYNNHHKGYLRLNFDTGLLPLGDFTLEYLAMYKPIYVADANGSILVVDGKKVEAYDAFAGALPTGWASSSNKALDRVGWYTSFTDCIDGGNTLANKDTSRGQIIWCFDNPTWTAGGNSRRVYSHVENDPYQTNNMIREYSISVDETLTGSGETTAVFALYRDSVSYFTQNASTSGTYGATYYAIGTAYKNKELSLSHSRPTDFFAVRIYNRALTVEEMQINRLVDLLLYYGVGLTEEQVANLKLRNNLATLLSSFAFVTAGEEVKAAKKEEIKAFIANYEVLDYSDTLYVTDGLTSLFTAFEGETDFLVSTSGSNYTWINRVEGMANATFTGSVWSVGETGGVGKFYIRGTYQNGAFIAPTQADANITKNYSLAFGTTILPKDDYTVEYLAFFPPFYAEVLDSNGNKTGEYYAHYDRTKISATSDISYRVDQIGWMEFINPYPGANYWGDNVLRAVLSKAECTAWDGTNANRKKYGQSGQLELTTRNTLKVDTYGFLRDETHTYDADGVTLTEQTATYTFAHNADPAEKKSAFYTTAKGVEVTGAYATGQYFFGDDDGRSFYLARSAGATFYAVRVYDRVLSDAEQKQNRLADVLYYCGIELSAPQRNDQTLLELLANAAIAIKLDPLSREADKQTILGMIADHYVAESEGYASYTDLYVKDGLVGLYFDDDSIDLANGTWENRAPNGDYNDATLTGTAWQKHATDGNKGIGYRIVAADRAAAAALAVKGAYGISLDDNYATLENFTVETFAKVYGMTDASDKRVRAPAQPYISRNNDFRFGIFTAMGIIGIYTSNNSTVGLTHRCSISSVDYYADNTAYTTSNTYVWRVSGTTNVFYKDASGFLTLDSTKTVPTAGVMQIAKATEGDNVKYTLTYNNKEPSTDTSQINSATDLVVFNISTTNHATWTAKNKTNAGRNFSLFNAMPATVFAIRVYEKTLTVEEKAQNRLADLLYYHDVTNIPADLAEDKDAIAAVISAAGTITISETAETKAANKAKLENAVASVYKKLTVNDTADRELTFDFIRTGTNFVLPEAVANKKVAAWIVDGGIQNPGSAITMDKNVTAKVLLVDAPATKQAVSLRTTDNADDLAMRFTATVSRADFEAIAEIYGMENLRIGMLITPAKYLEHANGVFTREALRAMVLEKTGDSSAPAFVDVKAGSFYSRSETTLTIAGSIYRFSNTTKQYNPAFTAIGYIDVYTAEGDLAFTIYGSYNPSVTHTVKDTMLRARPYMTDLQKNWIDTLLKSFGA